jgi:RNA polymerase sigma factor (sigma-70 family)
MTAGSDAAAAPADLARVFADERRFLFGLCYRMTGSAADADDLVQETFARALAKPPARTDAPWRPWLVRVALNLARDELRRRKRRTYKGPWLPEPVDDAEVIEPSHEPASTTGRYELLESVSFAFLLALEVLSPAQRAVLLLRDALDYTVAEAAQALDLSEANVRVLHHRARKAMAGYDAARCPPAPERTRAMLDMMARFMLSWGARDVPAMEALLAEDIVTLNDTNGRYPAAGVPVVGRNKVARFHMGIADLRETLPRFEVRMLNGVPAALASYDRKPDDRFAPAFITLAELDPAGRLRRIYTLLAPEKLARLIPSGTGSPASPRRRRRASRPRA